MGAANGRRRGRRDLSHSRHRPAGHRQAASASAHEQDRSGQHHRHRHRVVRFLRQRQRRRSRLRAAFLPGLQSNGQHPCGTERLRARLCCTPAGWHRLRSLWRPCRAQIDARDFDAADGFWHLPCGPAADLSADRHPCAGPSYRVAVAASHGSRRRMGRGRLAGLRVRHRPSGAVCSAAWSRSAIRSVASPRRGCSP